MKEFLENQVCKDFSDNLEFEVPELDRHLFYMLYIGFISILVFMFLFLHIKWGCVYSGLLQIQTSK